MNFIDSAELDKDQHMKVLTLFLLLASAPAFAGVSWECENAMVNAEAGVKSTMAAIKDGLASGDLTQDEAAHLKHNAAFLIIQAEASCEAYRLDSSEAIQARAALARKRSL